MSSSKKSKKVLRKQRTKTSNVNTSGIVNQCDDSQETVSETKTDKFIEATTDYSSSSSSPPSSPPQILSVLSSGNSLDETITNSLIPIVPVDNDLDVPKVAVTVSKKKRRNQNIRKTSDASQDDRLEGKSYGEGTSSDDNSCSSSDAKSSSQSSLDSKPALLITNRNRNSHSEGYASSTSSASLTATSITPTITKGAKNKKVKSMTLIEKQTDKMSRQNGGLMQSLMPLVDDDDDKWGATNLDAGPGWSDLNLTPPSDRFTPPSSNIRSMLPDIAQMSILNDQDEDDPSTLRDKKSSKRSKTAVIKGIKVDDSTTKLSPIKKNPSKSVYEDDEEEVGVFHVDDLDLSETECHSNLPGDCRRSRRTGSVEDQESGPDEDDDFEANGDDNEQLDNCDNVDKESDDDDLLMNSNRQSDCFLLINEQELLQVKTAEEFVAKLGCDARTFVKVVAIFGNTGEGKSHTLNYTFFNCEPVFHTSPTQNSCTIGIWCAYDRRRKVITIDTEGLLGLSDNNNRRTRLLLKVMAISDVIIYRTRAERLHNDLFTFLGSASHAYIKHFSKELRSASERCNLSPCALSDLGPVVIIFHETVHTEVLKKGKSDCVFK